MKNPKLTENSTLLLVELLARLDGLFYPLRSTRMLRPGDAAVILRRARFPQRGLEFSTGGSGAERQSAVKSLRQLAAAKLIKILETNATRRHLKLTDLGDNFARELAGFFRLHESMALIGVIEDTASRMGGALNQGYVPEHYILGILVPEDTTPFWLLQEIFLPLAWRGLLQSHSDARGIVGYRVTKLGRDAFLRWDPNEGRLPPNFDERLNDFYTEKRKDVLRERLDWVPSLSSEIYIPLSCGLWGLPPPPSVGGGALEELLRL